MGQSAAVHLAWPGVSPPTDDSVSAHTAEEQCPYSNVSIARSLFPLLIHRSLKYPRMHHTLRSHYPSLLNIPDYRISYVGLVYRSFHMHKSDRELGISGCGYQSCFPALAPTPLRIQPFCHH